MSRNWRQMSKHTADIQEILMTVMIGSFIGTLIGNAFYHLMIFLFADGKL